jgi:hypothetical protein
LPSLYQSGVCGKSGTGGRRKYAGHDLEFVVCKNSISLTCLAKHSLFLAKDNPTGNQTIGNLKIGRTASRTIQDQPLMQKQYGLCDGGTDAARPGDSDGGQEDMYEQEDEAFANRIRRRDLHFFRGIRKSP